MSFSVSFVYKWTGGPLFILLFTCDLACLDDVLRVYIVWRLEVGGWLGADGLVAHEQRNVYELNPTVKARAAFAVYEFRQCGAIGAL